MFLFLPMGIRMQLDAVSRCKQGIYNMSRVWIISSHFACSQYWRDGNCCQRKNTAILKCIQKMLLYAQCIVRTRLRQRMGERNRFSACATARRERNKIQIWEMPFKQFVFLTFQIKKKSKKKSVCPDSLELLQYNRFSFFFSANFVEQCQPYGRFSKYIIKSTAFAYSQQPI